MNWNYARLKLTFVGIIGLFITSCYLVNISNAINMFTSFEWIVLLMLGCILLIVSMAILFYGIEPMTPEFKLFYEKNREDD